MRLLDAFRRRSDGRAEPAVDPVARLLAAVDEVNAALADLPRHERLSPYVQRRAGQSGLLTLTRWAPDAYKTVYPPEATQTEIVR